MRAAYWNFGLFFVVHFEHVAGFEPGDHFANLVDVYEIGAMRAPKLVGVERSLQLFDGAVIGAAFEFSRDYGDEAIFESRRRSMSSASMSSNPLCADFTSRLGGLRGARRGRSWPREALRGDRKAENVRLYGIFSTPLDGAGDAGFVEGLQNVIDCVYFERLDRVSS